MSIFSRQFIRPCLKQMELRHFSTSALIGSQATPGAYKNPNWAFIVDSLPPPAPVETPEFITRELTPEERNDALWKEKSRLARASLKLHPTPNAYSGRSVRVNPKSGGILAAFSRLEKILKQNDIKSEHMRAKRHEKPGVKRRRLASETWRRVFAHEVRQSVQLVKKMRSRGA